MRDLFVCVSVNLEVRTSEAAMVRFRTLCNDEA